MATFPSIYQTKKNNLPFFCQSQLAFLSPPSKLLFCIFFVGLSVLHGHSFAYIAHFVFLRYVRVRTQRDAVASRRAANLTTISYWS
jgi:hypothetical protein